MFELKNFFSKTGYSRKWKQTITRKMFVISHDEQPHIEFLCDSPPCDCKITAIAWINNQRGVVKHEAIELHVGHDLDCIENGIDSKSRDWEREMMFGF